jgi:signal transduction histidine kinase/ActR/RegA family two-component response regulator
VTPTSPPLRWHRRLEAQVVGGIGLLIAGSLAAVIVATTQSINTRSLDRAAQDLQTARAAFEELTATRAEYASAQAALVTALPVFRAHMTDPRLASDVATLEAMGEEYRRQLKADFIIVTEHTGRWTSQSGWPGRGEQAARVRARIAQALAGAAERDIIVAGERLYLIVAEPARFADEVLGTLTLGFLLDDAVARRLASVAQSHVNLVVDGRLYASSLTGADRAGVVQLLRDGDLDAGGSPAIERLGEGEYVVESFPLLPRGDAAAGRLILLHDLKPTAQFVGEVRSRLLTEGLVVFAVAVGAGIIFSRRISRPLQDLADAARDIAAGNWTRRVSPGGAAETTMMADAFNDMTSSLRQSHEEVRKRDDQLRQAQKMEAIGRLAGGVAHDFNNLLTAIRGYSELVLESLEPDDRRREDVLEITAATDRAAALTRQLLAFSRRQLVTPRVIGLGTVVAGMEQMLRRLIGEHIELTSTLPVDAWRIRADSGQMEQVIMNLVVNARDAMPDGGKVHVELANVVFTEPSVTAGLLVSSGSYVRLSVSDNGSGMDQETASRIFEPFFTTKDADRGTGLGLATVYGIVEQAGGVIQVRTEPGAGTTFQVFLPRTFDQDPADAVLPPTRPTSPLHESVTVLLVEDDERVRTLLVNRIGKAGYTVIEAGGGEEALAVARGHEGPIHLLLTDVVMPRLNGRELAEQLTRERPEVRVLFMSGYSDDAILRQGIETATSHFIQKPFSIDALTVKLQETLRSGCPSAFVPS